jgi:hypothetical protein
MVAFVWRLCWAAGSPFGDKHKVGFGSVSVVDTNIALTGTLGEGPGRF